MKSYVSTHVPALLTGAEDTATSQDMMTRIRATLTEDGATAAKKLLPRLGDELVLVVITGITDMNGAWAWGALITRYYPRTGLEYKAS